MVTCKPPSHAKLDEWFNSPPARDVKRKSKSTTRTPHRSQQSTSSIMYAEGNNELCALRLMEYLWRCRLVKRFKCQPFDLGQLCGPPGHVVDLLVELFDGTVHVIQAKSKRFITPEVQAALDMEKEFLENQGFYFHVWTNRDRLGSPTNHSVNQIDRGFRFPADPSVLSLIEQRVREGASTLYPLLQEFGWDDLMSAAAYLKFHLNITKEIHENASVYQTLPVDFYAFLFTRRNESRSWWDSLTAATAAERHCGDPES